MATQQAVSQTERRLLAAHGEEESSKVKGRRDLSVQRRSKIRLRRSNGRTKHASRCSGKCASLDALVPTTWAYMPSLVAAGY